MQKNCLKLVSREVGQAAIEVLYTRSTARFKRVGWWATCRPVQRRLRRSVSRCRHTTVL